jgi:hypothetical protein
VSDIDWSTELRKIERQFDGLPPEPSSAVQRAKRKVERRAQERRDKRSAAFGVAVRLVLVVLLAGGLTLWPYTKECGAGLFAYMGAEVVVAIGGLWLIVTTWQHRMARMHAVGLIMLIGGVALIASSALPRVGYAKTDPAHPAVWICESSSAAQSR